VGPGGFALEPGVPPNGGVTAIAGGDYGRGGKLFLGVRGATGPEIHVRLTATELLSASPASGPVGSTVTITGRAFSPVASENEVTFWLEIKITPTPFPNNPSPIGHPAVVTSATPTTLTCVVPAEARGTRCYLSVATKGTVARTKSPAFFTVDP
jgi:hypothetical protein